MNMTTRLELRPIESLKPYAKNARTHSRAQIKQLRKSLQEFGFVSPVLITAAGDVIAGHGRIEAARAEGILEIPCVLVEHLTDDQRRAYILADNRLAEAAGWDEDLVSSELLALRDAGLSIELTGFDVSAIKLDGGNFSGILESEKTEEYDAFVEKFKPKLTTDDCYTPANVYNALLAWALPRYQIEAAPIVRPFYPGGDYQKFTYPDGCVVIDNPPFSILSEICRWYSKRGIRFLLFAPHLTLFPTASGEMNYLPLGIGLTFENGANISIGFVTNMGNLRIEASPELYAAIKAAEDSNRAAETAELPNYEYPPELVTSSMFSPLLRNGFGFSVPRNACSFTRALDAQREAGKAIFGAGMLISEKAAAEKAAAEKAAAEKAAAGKAAAGKADEKWQLSEREQEIVRGLANA